MDEQEKAKIDLQILNEEYRDPDFGFVLPNIFRIVGRLIIGFLIVITIGYLLKGAL